MDKKQSRREFLSKSVKILGGAMLLPIASACNTATVMEGETATYALPEDGTATVYEDKKLVISRIDKSVYAHSTVCTHLGCVVAYASESDSINCPCHGSTFALDGASTGGPAGRSLDRYKAVISGDKVEVDFSKVYKEGKDGYDGAVATIG